MTDILDTIQMREVEQIDKATQEMSYQGFKTERDLDLDVDIVATESIIIHPGWLEAVKKRAYSDVYRSLLYLGRRFALKAFAGVMFGTLVTLLLLYPFSNSTDKVEIPEAPLTLHVNSADSMTETVALEEPVLKLAPKEESVALVEEVVEEVAAQPKSGIVEYTRNKDVTLGARHYLYSADSQRGYDVSYAAPEDNPARAKKINRKVRIPSLEEVQGNSGRYKSAYGNTEWQGGWTLDDPKANIELGSSYQKYLDSSFGSDLKRPYAAFEKAPSNILKRVPKKASGPVTR